MAPLFDFIKRCCLITVSIFALTLLAGCSEQAEIRHYTVPKTAATETTAEPESKPAVVSRMLAAVIPHGSMAWFFKATGPETAVEASLDDFVDFLKSVRFGEEKEAKPTWKLPEGWKQKPGSELRFATIQIESALAPVELTVIPLGMPDGFNDEYTLSNVNRWRDQMQLAPITKDQLAAETKKLELEGGHEAVYVNLVGKLKGNTMGRPPFAGGAGPFAGNAPPPAEKRPVADAPPAESDDLTYETPAGWKKSQGNAFSKAAFKVNDGDQSIEITITIAGGDLAQNINRWRGQLKLKPWDAEELAKESKSVTLGDATGTYVAMAAAEDASPREAIYGVIAPHGGSTWFIKLKGSAALAEREKEKFEAFVKSIRFK